MRSVAFLRAINVGGKSSVKMAERRNLFEEAGFTDVSTHLQSGNVLFSHEAPLDVPNLEARLEGRFGFKIPVIVRNKEELEVILRVMPFDPEDEDHSHQFISLFPANFVGELPPDPPKGGCAYLGKTEREVFSRWWMVNGKFEIPSTPRSMRDATTRNRRVISALAEML